MAKKDSSATKQLEERLKTFSAKIKGANISSEEKKLGAEISQLSGEENFDKVLSLCESLLDSLKIRENDLFLREQKLTEREKEFTQNKNILDDQVRELERNTYVFEQNMAEYRKEEEKLRGLSKVDKILTLIEDLKDNIIVRNLLENRLIAEGEDPSKYNPEAKKILRLFGDYEFSSKDARHCQQQINKILKYLTLLLRNADEKVIGEFEERAFYKARGILKAFHFRFNIFDNHIHSKDSQPIELMRLFSALEPTIVSLVSLDDDATQSQTYDIVVKSFNDFTIDEKFAFFRNNFSHEFLESLDETTQKNIFTTLCSKMVLSPTMVLDQLNKWSKINLDLRKKFINLCAIELLPEEKHQIAKDIIEDLKNRGLIS